MINTIPTIPESNDEYFKTDDQFQLNMQSKKIKESQLKASLWMLPKTTELRKESFVENWEKRSKYGRKESVSAQLLTPDKGPVKACKFESSS